MLPPEKSLCQYLYELALRTPNRHMVGDECGWMTASRLMTSAASVCAQLSSCGVKPGDLIGLQAQRQAQTVAVLFGIRLLGAVAVLTDPHQKPELTLQSCAEQIDVPFYLTREDAGDYLLCSKNTSRIIRPGLPAPMPAYAQLQGDCRAPGFIIFTSGSTGKSKAVTLSDRNLIANLLDSAPIGGYRQDDIALGALPLDHVFGLVLTAGVAVLGYAMYMPLHTDVHSILTAIAQEKITRMNGVPSLYLAMAAAAEAYPVDSLRVGFIGGAPVTREQFLYIEQALDMTLVPVYGMSECIGISCGDYREDAQLRCSTVGRVYSMNSVRLLAEDASPVLSGQSGEIWVNGPARMVGYWPEIMDPQAYLPTGDLGYLTEDGHLVITGRKKEIMIRNGKNISPLRIEAALLSLEGVDAAAVVGLPDEIQGEVPFAMVVGTPDWDSLRKLLPKNELPVGILCTRALPMTPTGKPDKQEIRRQLLQWREHGMA